jgi:hypothetical protein
MFALLGILAMAVIVGKVAQRITPAVQLVLLVIITAIVLGEFVSWSGGQARSPAELIRGLLSWTR